jgi:hypothetical protein
VLKTRAGGSQTVGIKMRTAGKCEQFGIVRETRKADGTGLVEEILPLPKRPEGCPPWKYAISLPAKADKENAIIFLNGRFRWVWLTDARTQIPWKTSAQPAFPEMVRASIATNREPHVLFLEEALDIYGRWKAGEGKPDRDDPWPPLLRLRWLELLLATEAGEEQWPDRTGILQLHLPAEATTLQEIIETTRKAATVSLAAFTPTETALAHRAIENSELTGTSKKTLLELLVRAQNWTGNTP